MRLLATILTAALTFASLSAMAQHYETPEVALTEHIAAYKARDVERFLASLDFQQEAIEKLSKRTGATLEPSQAEVQERATALLEELREHFVKFGFRAATLDNCQIATKFQDTESQVRIVLSCSNSRGSATFPVRIRHLAQGWRIVRGG